MELEQKVTLLNEWLNDKKANNILNIDVSDRCNFTEYIIICTGTATLHNKAIADFIIDKAKENKIKILSKEGMTACTWILLDMNDVILHIFSVDTLEMYKLEDLWKERNDKRTLS